MRARFLLALTLFAGCASTPPPQPPPVSQQRPPAPPANASLTKGNNALAHGDVVAAARIYAAVPETDPDHAAAVKALETVQPEVAAVAQLWLKQADRSIKQERYQAAAKRLEHLSQNFTLDEATRKAVEEALVIADQGIAVSRANLEELDKQAQPLIVAADYAAAVRTLRRASTLARDIAPESLLDRERVIAALEQRVAASTKALEPATVPQPVKETKPRRRRRGEKEQPAAPAPTAAAATTVTLAADEPEGEAASENTRVRELLDEAQTFLDNKTYFNAIVDYLRVCELDRGNSTARAALTQLEPRRQELVAQYLDTANQYFMQQDLQSAVPYFRRVLLLDPDNGQAKKGLEMHYNLERIRRERGGR